MFLLLFVNKRRKHKTPGLFCTDLLQETEPDSYSCFAGRKVQHDPYTHQHGCSLYISGSGELTFRFNQIVINV